jgi:hypothetical protein
LLHNCTQAEDGEVRSHLLKVPEQRAVHEDAGSARAALSSTVYVQEDRETGPAIVLTGWMPNTWYTSTARCSWSSDLLRRAILEPWVRREGGGGQRRLCGDMESRVTG